MKKLFIALLACLLLAGCSSGAAVSRPPASLPQAAGGTGAPAFHGTLSLPHIGQGDVLEIPERLFVAQINDIYLNAPDYLGRTLKYEGIFASYREELTGANYYYVIRYGPGCCGTDANVGFEIQWAGDIPQPGDWVEVVGTLCEYERDGWVYLYLEATSLQVLPTRGAETVL